MRRSGITATDAVVLASGSDWHGRTVHDVWRAKVLGQDDFTETEATSLGSELEPVVLRRAAEKRGLRWTPGGTIRSMRDPLWLATPDAYARPFDDDGGPSSLIQAKVVGYHARRPWGEDLSGADGIPEVVLIQCAWELTVADVPLEYVGAMMGTEVRTYLIDRERDGIDELFGGLAEIARAFWADYVEPRKPPPVDGSEGARRMLQAVWPKPTAPVLQAPANVEPWVARYFRARELASRAEAAQKLAQQKIIETVGPHEGMTGDGWSLSYKFRDAVPVPGYTRAAYRAFSLRPKKGP